MKRLNILFVVFLGALFLYSCLGEGGHVIRVEAYPGVVSVDNSGDEQKIYIYIPGDERIMPNSSGSLSLGNGECVLVNYKIDLDDSNNQNIGSDGYYTVDLINTPTVLAKQPVLPELTDTATVLPAERLITSFDKRYAVIQNQLFLYTNYTVVDSIPIVNTYNMSFLPTQEAEVDETVGASIYELFLRVQEVETEGKTGDKSFRDVTPFSISGFIDTFKSKEIAKDSTNLYFRIKYPRSFNEDRTIINWGESEIMKAPVR